MAATPESEKFQGYPILFLKKMWDSVSSNPEAYIRGDWTPFTAEEYRLDKSAAGIAHRKKYLDAARAYFDKPSVDSRLTDTQNLQLKQAQAFKENLPLFQKQLGYDVSTQGAQGLAEKIVDVNRGANRRGLLYSGLRSNEEAKARSGAALDTAKQKMQTNEALQGIQSNLNQAPINTGFEIAGQGQKASQINFSDQQKSLVAALERRNQNDKATSGLLSGIGAGVGYGLGR